MMMEVDLSMFYDYLTLYGKMCNISIEIVDKNIFEKVCTINLQKSTAPIIKKYHCYAMEAFCPLLCSICYQHG